MEVGSIDDETPLSLPTPPYPAHFNFSIRSDLFVFHIIFIGAVGICLQVIIISNAGRNLKLNSAGLGRDSSAYPQESPPSHFVSTTVNRLHSIIDVGAHQGCLNIIINSVKINIYDLQLELLTRYVDQTGDINDHAIECFSAGTWPNVEQPFNNSRSTGSDTKES